MIDPGVAEEKSSREHDDEEVRDKEQCRAYRRAAARRLKYMAQDRADLAYTAKEVSRAMASHRPSDVVILK